MVDNKQFTLRKKERLSGKTRIDKLFSSGAAFLSYPFRVVFHIYDNEEKESFPAVLISIPKKRLKKAVDRNRIKRMTKEAYRLNKSSTILECTVERKQIDIVLIYVCNDVLSYDIIEKGVKRALRDVSKRIMKEYNENHA